MRAKNSIEKIGVERASVLALCLAIFFADASQSATIPTFPFFAISLGASLTMIGALASASGVSTAVSSIPMGGLSGRYGRRLVMLLGFLCFILTPLIYTVSSNPIHLLISRIVLGLGMGSTFSIGFVYITELVIPEIRGVAQGLYMTSMGLGFTIGPLIGGISAKIWGYSFSFYLSSGLAIAGFLIILTVLRDISVSRIGHREDAERDYALEFREVLADPRIIAAGVANFFNTMVFRALMIFFPLYGGLIGLDESQLGFSLTVRGLSSTASRFPSGAVARKVKILKLMAVGLGISASALFFLPSFADLTMISMILGVQGVAYGVYLTAGNAYVAEIASSEIRGIVTSVYSTFSNTSGVISPFILGAIAERWGIQWAFQVSAILSYAGLIMMLMLVKRAERLEPTIDRLAHHRGICALCIKVLKDGTLAL